MLEANEHQGVERLAEDLFEVRVEKARTARREKELAERLREELGDCKSFGVGDIRIEVKGGGPEKRFKRERVRRHVGETVWTSFFELEPGTSKLHVRKRKLSPAKWLEQDGEGA